MFLSSNVVDDILNKDHVSNYGFESMHVIDEVQNYHFYLTCVLIHNI